jgi:hypothetical protein
MKDKDQKAKALRYCVSKRWFPQLEVDVHAPHAVAKKTALMTDLDVLAAVPDDFTGFRQVVFDCKTLNRESPVNRSLWLRGVLDRMNADHGICILKKNSIEADHKLVATRLGVVLLAEDEFDIYAEATSAQYRDTTGHTANMDAWDRFFAIKDRSPALEPAIQFVRSGYWMQSEPGEACRKTVGALHEVRAELDPAKPEHLALAADFAALFGRTLALLTSYLFRAYLHPKNKQDLEEAVKVLLYGGRDAYEHRNQLYRLLRERTGSSHGSTDLALPEWPRFVQLVRQLLDAPIEAAKTPLILREIAFSRLLGSTDLEFARTLCKESPQAGRFAVLILSYLIKSARLPVEFSNRLESPLLALLDK